MHPNLVLLDNTKLVRMVQQIKLLNLPWTFTRQEVTRLLNRTLNTRLRYSRILYDKITGLSRGVAVVQFENEQLSKDMLRRGTLEIDGRTVIVVKGSEQTRQQRSLD